MNKTSLTEQRKFNTELAQRIVQYRKEYGIHQYEVAKYMNLTAPVYNRLERGGTHISAFRLKQFVDFIAKKTGVFLSVDKILYGRGSSDDHFLRYIKNIEDIINIVKEKYPEYNQ